LVKENIFPRKSFVSARHHLIPFLTSFSKERYAVSNGNVIVRLTLCDVLPLDYSNDISLLEGKKSRFFAIMILDCPNKLNVALSSSSEKEIR
jgi:hypothetical protein